ncbi:hypothetical protein CQ12_35985 [Bradyrhizobium jicamae]|uniref:Transcriptional regulator n=1 Tax=Bradyrhizobium jicamae TaxID=280332 RepID=A0A0R3KSA1_9BRAD|nr:PAS domain-containing protein [Bradyrhizobium jicamae]KRQ96430.1 hypothetical protein CQ12_35985 [Bradyrhizobium jicamae]
MTARREHELHEEEVLRLLASAVRVIGSVVGNNVEVVLHDLRKPEYSILEIANAHVTGRKKGDAVIAGVRTDKAFISAMEESSEPISLILDYETSSRSGSPLRSSTAVYRGRKNKPFAALCVNVDHAEIKRAITLLEGLANIVPPQPTKSRRGDQTAEPEPDNIEVLMHEIISTATEQSESSNRNDTKKANLLAVQKMQERGIFIIKGGVEMAAKALGVTRYTIYNYLDELKNAPR